MASHVTYKYIKENADIMEYIRRADETLAAMGYTEHSFAHVEKVAHDAAMILEALGYDERTVELARIAGMMHDIGNVINRIDHAQSGAVMAFRLLDNMNMPASEICSIISAIGNHDEGTGMPLDPLSAALIIADKTDVRRSRVRNQDPMTFDIHDRVNYAVTHTDLSFSEDKSAQDIPDGFCLDFRIFPKSRAVFRNISGKSGFLHGNDLTALPAEDLPDFPHFVPVARGKDHSRHALSSHFLLGGFGPINW